MPITPPRKSNAAQPAGAGPQASAREHAEDRRRTATRDQVRLGIEGGLRICEIARGLDISPSTVCYHARRLGYPARARPPRTFDWARVQAYHDAGHGQIDCRGRFGFSHHHWVAAVERGDLVPRSHLIPLDELLVEGRRTNRRHLKARLVRAGLKEDRCEQCGITDWNGSPLSLAVHHVNGHADDNRLHNIALLCPNCHSQTDTFAGRNLRRTRPPVRPEDP